MQPTKWDLIRSKLGMNPTVLKLSVIFGDIQATHEMEKVVVDEKVDSTLYIEMESARNKQNYGQKLSLFKLSKKSKHMKIRV